MQHPTGPEIVEMPQERAPVPPRAVIISAIALAVPVLNETMLAPSSSEYEALLWLLLLVPAFLLSYYRGWAGSLVALGMGMVSLTAVHLLQVWSGREVENEVLLGLLAVVILVMGLALGIVTELLHRARVVATAMAFTDVLTGLPNRRHTELFLEREVAAAQRGRNLVVVMWDVDHFKSFNDRYGHRKGDEVLRAVASTLSRFTRRMNLTGRYGGEEFLSVLSSSDQEGARVFVERVMEAIAKLGTVPEPLTISAGMAVWGPDIVRTEELLEAADRALYRAKAEGRNTYRVSQPPGPVAGAGELEFVREGRRA